MRTTDVRVPVRLIATLSLLPALSLGCSSGPNIQPATAENVRPLQIAASTPETTEVTPTAPVEVIAASGTWIGAAGLSGAVLAGTSETVVGVWVDVPSAVRRVHTPTAVAVVVDTSGSMSGTKIEHAREASKALINKLSDGDLVSLCTFSDKVDELFPLTPLSAATRPGFISALGNMRANGGTNLFDGIRVGEKHAFTAPATHTVKRVVLVSDGIATVGATSPELLGELAARGAQHGIQVTAVGVGLDYDEKTLNKLAIDSSGRMYHLADTKDLSAILEKEMNLLQATAATEALVEVVPAPGVQILAVEGQAATWNNGTARVSLGSLFAGQHQEMLLRVRVTATMDGSQPLASVRLHFRDPADGNVERVQEVVARYERTSDLGVIAQKENEKTRQILSVQEARKITASAAASAGQGDLAKAEAELARAEEKLAASARAAKDKNDQDRISSVAAQVSKARAAAKQAATSPSPKAPAARSVALDANDAAMEMQGR